MLSPSLPPTGWGNPFPDHPALFVLIGPPGSGKTTWRESYLACTDRRTCVLSTDDQIEAYAAIRGLRYSEVFDKVDFRSMEAGMLDALRQAVLFGMDIVVDRTNMRRKSRCPFIEGVGPDYYRVAVIFEVEREELQRRLDLRGTATGKFIPRAVVDTMIEGFEAPDRSEFDRMITQ